MRQRRPSFATRFDPVAAYLMTGSERTVDRSGNGHTLTPTGTFTLIASPFSGYGATLFTSNSLLQTSDSDLNPGSGVVTVEQISCSPTNAAYRLSYWAGDGEAEGDNYTLDFILRSDVMESFHEYGAGTDARHTVPVSIVLAQWNHFVWVRAANASFKAYLNGVYVGQSVTPASPPTGGGSGSWRMDGVAATGDRACLYYAQYHSELSDDQILYLAKLRGFAA